MFKVNNKETRTTSLQWRSGLLIVNLFFTFFFFLYCFYSARWTGEYFQGNCCCPYPKKRKKWQTWVSSAFPRNFRGLHVKNFQNKILCLLCASCVHVFNSLTLKQSFRGHCLLCSLWKRFRVFYFFVQSCLKWKAF